MSFSITLEWKERVEDSFVLDYKDRPRYLHADFLSHEYKISENDAGFHLTANKKGYSNTKTVKGSPFGKLPTAKRAACCHAAKLMRSTVEALNDARNYADQLEVRQAELADLTDELREEVETAEQGTLDAAKNLRERITLFSYNPIEALNEFLREQQVEEVS